MKDRGIRLVAASVGIAAGLVVAAGAAAAQDACKPGETKRIAFMLKQQTAFRYLNADVPFFKKTAEAAGYEVLVQSAENDAQNQIAQAENVITQGVDAIVIQPVDFNVAAGIAEMAAEAGIPLASYDDLILNADAGRLHRPRPEGRRRRGGARGRRQGARRATTCSSAATPGRPARRRCRRATTRCSTRWSRRATSPSCMDQFTPAWKTEPAQANAENALTVNDNEVDAFLVSYDGMSLGVLQAIEAAGIDPGKILVTGQDMELSAAQAIVEGRQFGSLWPAPDEMAVAGAKVAVAMAKCEDIGATATANNGAGGHPVGEDADLPRHRRTRWPTSSARTSTG